MKRNKYLGVRVKDLAPLGLSHEREFLGIINKILYDYYRKRINKKTARGRLLLLYRLTFKKNNSKIRFDVQVASRIRRIIRRAMRELNKA